MTLKNRDGEADKSNPETPRETARKILARRGLRFLPGRKPVTADAYHDLDHELESEGPNGHRPG